MHKHLLRIVIELILAFALVELWDSHMAATIWPKADMYLFGIMLIAIWIPILEMVRFANRYGASA